MTASVPSWLPPAMSGLRSSVEEAQHHMQAAAEEQKQVCILGGREEEWKETSGALNTYVK